MISLPKRNPRRTQYAARIREEGFILPYQPVKRQ
jgi:hypothetical protein